MHGNIDDRWWQGFPHLNYSTKIDKRTEKKRWKNECVIDVQAAQV